MNNVEIVLAVIVIAAIIIILNYLLDRNPVTSIPSLIEPRIKIRDISGNIPDNLWYSVNNSSRILVNSGEINQIDLHYNVIAIGINDEEELSFTESPSSIFVNNMLIIIDDNESSVCTLNRIRINGTVIANDENEQISVRDVTSGRPPTSIPANNSYSNCYTPSPTDDCAEIEFYWGGHGSLGLKIKKKVKNSSSQINITLTDTEPMIPPNPVFTGTTSELPSTSNPNE